MLLVLKEIRATRGFQAEKAVTVYLEVLDHKVNMSACSENSFLFICLLSRAASPPGKPKTDTLHDSQSKMLLL